MSVRSYKQILERAETCQKYVKKHYKIGISYKWSYYFAEVILNNSKKDITKIKHEDCEKQSGDYISRQINKADYLDVCKRYTQYIKKHNKFPNYIKLDNKNISPNLLCEVLSRIVIYINTNNTLPKYANINSKVFDKPSETGNEVYDYFVKVFGNFGDTIDGALSKISNKGYGYYYDDQKTNKQTIDAMKDNNHSNDPNCTDSCQVFKNIGDVLVKKGKYKKVDVLHIKCQGGDGHVRLRITNNDGSVFYRDPACTLDNGGYCNWCMNGTVLAVNPSWFMANLYR